MGIVLFHNNHPMEGLSHLNIVSYNTLNSELYITLLEIKTTSCHSIDQVPLQIKTTKKAEESKEQLPASLTFWLGWWRYCTSNAKVKGSQGCAIRNILRPQTKATHFVLCILYKATMEQKKTILLILFCGCLSLHSSFSFFEEKKTKLRPKVDEKQATWIDNSRNICINDNCCCCFFFQIFQTKINASL